MEVEPKFQKLQERRFSMKSRFKSAGLAVLLLIPFLFLVPNIGFSSGEPCSGTTGYVLPPYLGSIIVEWVPVCDVGTGCVLFFGEFRSVERRQKDIIIKKKEPIIMATGIDQTVFLSLESADLRFNYSFNWQGQCLQVSSANNLDFKSGTAFTVDVVVMAVQ
jgi:hypothetical protein